MQLKKHTLKVEKTAHYGTYGQLSDQTSYFWFVLHGSHMLCEQMLYKFENFDPSTHFVVAPEGLSRFYLKGFSGDVVATWMTKQDRLTEIEDFSTYLHSLYSSYLEKLPKNCKKIVFGFSQGGTSAFRWLHRKKTDLDVLLAYSTWIPEDIDFTKSHTSFDRIKLLYTIGNQDMYLSNGKKELLFDIIQRNGFEVALEFYEGIHKVKKSQLKFLFKKYIQE